jgi:hypothetical protein
MFRLQRSCKVPLPRVRKIAWTHKKSERIRNRCAVGIEIERTGWPFVLFSASRTGGDQACQHVHSNIRIAYSKIRIKTGPANSAKLVVAREGGVNFRGGLMFCSVFGHIGGFNVQCLANRRGPGLSICVQQTKNNLQQNGNTVGYSTSSATQHRR